MKESLQLWIDDKEITRSSSRTKFLSLSERKSKVTIPVTLVEKVLISKIKEGDSKAFSNVFTAYYKDLVIYAEKFTRDLNVAEEIVQGTFLKLWEIRESLSIKTSIKSYLLKSVHNKCIDWYRHETIVRIYHDSMKEYSISLNYDTDNYILSSELHEQIETALAKLPEELSEVYKMNRNRGLKYHEIAALQGVSVRTIEVRIGKALHMLRNYLKEYFVVVIFLFCIMLP